MEEDEVSDEDSEIVKEVLAETENEEIEIEEVLEDEE